MSRALMTIAATAAVYSQTFSKTPVQNEPKRKFYEDEQSVVPVPGTVTASTPAEQEILGPRSVVNGVTVRTSTPLENALRSARQTAHCAYSAVYNYVHDTKHTVFETEREVTGTVAALHSKHEDLFPNSVYILIAALSGNIAARRRGFVARAVFPVVLGGAAFRYFLPQTFENSAGFLWAVEKKALPEVAKQQAAAYVQATNLVGQVEASAAAGQQKASDGWEHVRQTVSRATGLNLDEEVSKK